MRFAVAILFFLLWGYVPGQVVAESYPALPCVTELRKAMLNVAESQVGVRELTGNNDGQEVEMYLATTGLGKGYAWCAAFVAWTHEQVRVPNPRSAWSPAWFTGNIVYRRNHVRIQPFVYRPGQVFGLYYDNLKRVGHVGIIAKEQLLHYITIEGNTNGDGVREGDGVYRKIRRKANVHVIADHVGAREIETAKLR